MSLSPAEKLQAIASPYSTWISLLLKKWIYGPGKWNEYYPTWDKARARDFSNVAIMIMMITQYPTLKTSFGAAQITTWLNRTDLVSLVCAILLELFKLTFLAGRGFTSQEDR